MRSEGKLQTGPSVSIREKAGMEIRRCMHAPTALAAAADIHRLEADVVVALVQRHVAQGYRLVEFEVDRDPMRDAVRTTLIMARTPACDADLWKSSR